MMGLPNVYMGFASKWVSSKGGLKIPAFLLELPAGLLLTVIGIVGLASLGIVLTPVHTIRYGLWRLSAKGRLQHIRKKYQRREQKVIAREQRKRLKLSLRADKADIKYLVKLSKNELNKRKQYVDDIVLVQTERRLNGGLTEMNFDDAHRIHSTIVDTEFDLLNESLKTLFK